MRANRFTGHLTSLNKRRPVVLGGVLLALVLLSGLLTACELAPNPGTSNSPSGYVDVVTGGADSVRVEGWTSDWNTLNPINVVVMINGAWAPGVFNANLSRTDVAARYGRGANFGFDVTLPVPAGPVSVCVVALNVGRGENTILGCVSTTATTPTTTPTSTPTTTTPPPTTTTTTTTTTTVAPVDCTATPAPYVNLSGCDLSGVILPEVNLTDANLTDANLTDANLFGANLTDANLSGANLTDAKMRDGNLTDANLTGANLLFAYLRDANLSGANLTSASLRAAHLSGADLTGANLTSADLRNASLVFANLTGADLTGANLNFASLDSATWSNTTCPNGVVQSTECPRTSAG